MNEAGSILDILQTAGITGLLVIAIVGAFRGWYVFRSQHEYALKVAMERLAESERIAAERLAEAKKDRDEWKTIALQSLTTAERAAVVAEKVATGGKT